MPSPAPSPSPARGPSQGIPKDGSRNRKPGRSVLSSGLASGAGCRGIRLPFRGAGRRAPDRTPNPRNPETARPPSRPATEVTGLAHRRLDRERPTWLGVRPDRADHRPGEPRHPAARRDRAGLGGPAVLARCGQPVVDRDLRDPRRHHRGLDRLLDRAPGRQAAVREARAEVPAALRAGAPGERGAVLPEVGHVGGLLRPVHRPAADLRRAAHAARCGCRTGSS